MAESDSNQKSKDQQAQKPQGPSAADWAAMQEQMRLQNEQIALLVRANAELQKQAGGHVLPEEEQPMYECAQPFYSPDDVYYPEGVQFVDVTGDLPLNEFLIPLNAPAQERMDAYLGSLPVKGRQPTISEMIDVVSRTMQSLGKDAPSDVINAAVAAAINQTRAAAERRPAMNEPASPYQRRPSNVPLMSNTRITGAGGASLQSRPAAPRTRAVGEARPSAAPVMSGVPSAPNAYAPA